MLDLAELRLLIDQEFNKIQFPKKPKNLYQPLSYTLSLNGKRMRPILLLMAHQLFNKDIKRAIKPALGIEVFHNFTLLHDDIMDKALLRRGQKTVHEKWNNNIAVLSGDIMLVKAYQFICDVDKHVVKDVLNVFNQAAIDVCEGQQWDMDFETQNNVGISEYLKMIERKTSVLLSAALQIGAIIAGACHDEQNNLYEFGRNIGIAFQLKDDLLDTFGSSETFGKEVGGDIMTNKKTYLYLKALEIANENQYETLISYYRSDDNSNEKVKNVKSIFTALEIPELTTNLMKNFHQKAMKHLNAIESNNKDHLMFFSEKLLDRIS